MAMYSTQTPSYPTGVNNPPHPHQQYYQQSMPGPSTYPGAAHAQPQPPQHPQQQAYAQPQQQQQWYGQQQHQQPQQHPQAPPPQQPPQPYQQPPPQSAPQPGYHQQSFGQQPQPPQQPYAQQSFGQQAYPQQTYGSYGQSSQQSHHSQPSPHSSYHSHPSPHQSYGQHPTPQQYAPQQQYPQQSLPQTHHGAQQAYQQSYAAQPYLEQQTPPRPLARSDTVAIPSPQRKTDYQAPAFKTFQERKREREAALRAAATASAASTPTPSTPTPPPAAQTATSSPAQPNGQSPAPSQPNLPPHVLAMMGAPGSGRPVPLPRANGSPAPPQRNQPVPGQQSQPPQPPQRSPSPQPPSRSHSPQPPQRSAPPQPPQPPQRSASPQPPPRSVSPQPPQRNPSPSPAHPSLANFKQPPASTSKFAPPPAPPSWMTGGSDSAPKTEGSDSRSSSPTREPLPRASEVPKSPQPTRMGSQNGSGGRALPTPAGAPSDAPTPSAYQLMRSGGFPSNIPRNRAVEESLQRSDTVASVKSLDRGNFGPGKRVLPSPPVGVSASQSSDRGAMSAAAGIRRSNGRKSPSSPIAEEGPDDLAQQMAGMSVGSGSRSPTSNGSNSPRTPMTPVGFPQAPTIVTPDIPVISVGEATPKVPQINIGSPPRSRSPAPSVPQINIGSPPRSPRSVPAVPTISVGSPPKPPPRSVPSINVGAPQVPSINVGSPPKAPSIRVASPVNDGPQPPSIVVPPPSISIGSAPSSPRAERPASPSGFEFSGQPTIAVESSDTRASAGPTRVHASSAIVCAGCNEAIIGRIVSAMGKRFHPQCFQCGVCGEHSEHVSAYEHDGQPYCHSDYHERFAPKCHHCRTPIVDPRFITSNDEESGQRFYHESHFFCSECGDPFLDPSKSSAPGTQRSEAARRGIEEEDEVDETNDFVIHKGHPYCERCHLKLHKPKCKACRQPIPDIAVGALGGKWHRECFVCEQCRSPFANNLFFPLENKAYCVECFEGMQ